MIAPGAEKAKEAIFFFELTLELEIAVPLGTPKVAVTVWSVSIFTRQGPMPEHGPEKPAKPPAVGSARST